MYGIYCTQSGGITGKREEWLKDDKGVMKWLMQREAEEYLQSKRDVLRDSDGGCTPSGRQLPVRRYKVKLMD